MTMQQSPLDLNIVLSAEERRTGRLSQDHIKLGVLLLHARGYVVLKGAVPDQLVAELQTAFNSIYAENVKRFQEKVHYTEYIGDEPGSNSVFWERKCRFRIAPKLKGPFANPYIVRNPFADVIVKETIGEDYYCKFVSSDTCVKGAIKQAPHRDTDFYNEDDVRGCIVNIPITECGLHNGPMEVWPGGSHLWRSEKFFKFELRPFIQDDVNPEVEAFAKYIPSKLIELVPGDVMVRDPGMWHRGTPNPTDEPRTMLTEGFFRSDFMQDYGDPFHNVDEGLYKQLEPSVQKLFAPFFDPADSRYWSLRRTRAIRRVSNQRYLGAPLRIGMRYLERITDKFRTWRGA
jgi:ectoine hydroxylase-related dioxygenase (phytanoyl-CoA dioxygenase family)